VLPLRDGFAGREANAARSDERMIPARAFDPAHHFRGPGKVIDQGRMMNRRLNGLEWRFLQNRGV
jgi:hypothetical protein